MKKLLLILSLFFAVQFTYGQTQGFNGSSWEGLRTPNTFKTATATASGNTAVWTPASGKKFRLMKYCVTIAGNSSFATTAGILTITFQDNITDMKISYILYIPALTGLVAVDGVLFNTGWVDLGNGILSSTANNVLNVNLSIGGSGSFTNGVVVNCIGVEE